MALLPTETQATAPQALDAKGKVAPERVRGGGYRHRLTPEEQASAEAALKTLPGAERA